MRQRRETVELGTIKSTMGRAFGASVFVLGFICALLRIGRNAFRYTGITRAVVITVSGVVNGGSVDSID
jgi:hypothetical protein